MRFTRVLPSQPIVLVFLAAIALPLLAPVAAPPEADDEGWWRERQARRVLEALEMMDVCAENDLRRCLGAATWHVPDDLTVTSEHRDALVDLTATFLTLRMCEESPDPYRAWREESGNTFASREAAVALGALNTLAYCGGDIEPEELSAAELFNGLWAVSRTSDRCALLIKAVATEPKAMVIAVKELTVDDRKPPIATSEIPNEIWYGRAGTGGRRWWSRGADAHNRVAPDRSVRIAVASVVAEFNDGVRRPVHLTFRWEEAGDGAEGGWLFERMNVNMPYGTLSVVIDY